MQYTPPPEFPEIPKDRDPIGPPGGQIPKLPGAGGDTPPGNIEGPGISKVIVTLDMEPISRYGFGLRERGFSGPVYDRMVAGYREILNTFQDGVLGAIREAGVDFREKWRYDHRAREFADG